MIFDHQDKHNTTLASVSSLESVRWRKSSFSANGECVTVRIDGDMVAICDSKDPDAGSLHFTASEWAAFVAGVKAGEFDDLVA